ncbi:hypothetical protein B0I37DRAFT_411510 [Chaetomium sp. MPI-CAGE-AT-0009]|nr:hypothetical protein B0I37DRAFT_411510 [Chaetomium sp. MPI-CAGE-AT-0009]
MDSRPGPIRIGDTSTLASDAFKAAKAYFEQSNNLSNQEKKLVGGSSCIEDVHQVLAGLVTNLGTNVIQTLSTSATPTLWVFTSAEKPASGSSILTPADLMKYLIYQALQLSSQVRTVAPTEGHIALCHSQFCTAETPKEWFDLFERVVASIPGELVYLVVDLATVCSESVPPEGFNFVQELHGHMVSSPDRDASRRGTPKLKVVLLLYEANGFSQLSKAVSNFIVPVKTTPVYTEPGAGEKATCDEYPFYSAIES